MISIWIFLTRANRASSSSSGYLHFTASQAVGSIVACVIDLLSHHHISVNSGKTSSQVRLSLAKYTLIHKWRHSLTAGRQLQACKDCIVCCFSRNVTQRVVIYQGHNKPKQPSYLDVVINSQTLSIDHGIMRSAHVLWSIAACRTSCSIQLAAGMVRACSSSRPTPSPRHSSPTTLIFGQANSSGAIIKVLNSLSATKKSSSSNHYCRKYF